MATAHLSVKVGKAGKATPHAEYIMREGKYAARLHDEKLEAVESGNMPSWAADEPMRFWLAADVHERKNGTVYREHEIALPRELTAEQRADLVRDWVRQEIGDRHAYTWAIHNKTALDGKEQPHVHLMYSERINDGIERDAEQYFKRYNAKHPERGGAKKHRTGETPTERREALKQLRERWEEMHNAHIERQFDRNTIIGRWRSDRAKISMKSLAEQGIDRQADRKMLPSESNAMHRQRKAAEYTAQVMADRAAIERQRQAAEIAEQQRRERQEQYRKAQEEEWARIEAEIAAEADAEWAEPLPEQEQEASNPSPYDAMPIADLLAAHQAAKKAEQAGQSHFVGQARRIYSFFNEEKAAKDAADRCKYLELRQKQIVDEYRDEKRRREGSLFGLSAKLIKENGKQKQLKDDYTRIDRELVKAKEALKEAEENLHNAQEAKAAELMAKNTETLKETTAAIERRQPEVEAFLNTTAERMTKQIVEQRQQRQVQNDFQAAYDHYRRKAEKLSPSAQATLRFYERTAQESVSSLDEHTQLEALRNFYEYAAKHMKGSKLDLPEPKRTAEPQPTVQKKIEIAQDHDAYEVER